MTGSSLSTDENCIKFFEVTLYAMLYALCNFLTNPFPLFEPMGKMKFPQPGVTGEKHEFINLWTSLWLLLPPENFR